MRIRTGQKMTKYSIGKETPLWRNISILMSKEGVCKEGIRLWINNTNNNNNNNNNIHSNSSK